MRKDHKDRGGKEMKIIHKDTGSSYMASISGRHTVCLCGKWFQDNYIPDKDRHTKNWKKVTCKKCLNKK